MKRYYSFVMVDDVANIDIYGDIIAYPFEEFGEVSAYSLAKQLEQISAREIHVCINSYGGDVAEGVAIYNALKRKAATCKVVTYCDGFACSIASVVFMAGSERVMNEASALMIHNAWTFAQGNAAELRKQADDLDTISSLSVTAYMTGVNLTEKQVKKLMDNETWIVPSDALAWGFATSIEAEKSGVFNQSARKSVFERFFDKIGENSANTSVEAPNESKLDETEIEVEEPTDGKLGEIQPQNDGEGQSSNLDELPVGECMEAESKTTADDALTGSQEHKAFSWEKIFVNTK